MVQTSETCVENIDTGITCEDKQKLIQETGANPEQANVVSEVDFERAIKLYQQGKKDLLLSKYDDAVNNIGDACKIYSSKYGELASECADIYFYYGKALLELARVENTVLGNALNGVPEESEPIDDSRYGNPETVPEEERENIAEQVLDAMCDTDGEVKKDGENGTTEAKPDEAAAAAAPETPATTTTEKPVETKPEGEAEKVEAKEEAAKEEKCENGEKPVEEKKEEKVEEKKEEKPEEKKEEKEKEKENDAAGASGANEEEKIEVDEDENENEGEEKEEEDVGGEENDEDDVTNLQQAWEMFELAKLIYTKYYKEKDDEDKYFKVKRVCECLLKLGEVSIEQELFDQAINDIKESIKTQETEITGENIDKRDERLLAESYYQLALAYQFSNKCDLAKESHNKATNILLILVEKLKAKLAQIGESKGDDDFEKKQLNEEINELELLIPQMCAKLEEINEQGQQEEQQINIIKEAAKECFLSAANAAATNGAGTSDQVKDITNSIKSKRKLSSSSENLDKKMKTENGECAVEANGGSEEKSTTNGGEHAATENSETPNGNNVEIVS